MNKSAALLAAIALAMILSLASNAIDVHLSGGESGRWQIIHTGAPFREIYLLDTVTGTAFQKCPVGIPSGKAGWKTMGWCQLYGPRFGDGFLIERE